MLVTQVEMGERKVKWSLIMWMISGRLSSRGERERGDMRRWMRDTRYKGGAERKQKLGWQSAAARGKES